MTTSQLRGGEEEDKTQTATLNDKKAPVHKTNTSRTRTLKEKVTPAGGVRSELSAVQLSG